jgi:hypothetical protein
MRELLIGIGVVLLSVVLVAIDSAVTKQQIENELAKMYGLE